ncbi:MAG: family 16 glycosylhydrolase [Rikenellaceae bacterium]
MKRLLLLALLPAMVNCSEAPEPQPLPFSDPENTGNWVLNTEISDEFNGTELDEDRWFIVGKFVDGKPTYIHPDKPDKKVWTGRAPSQFSGRNHRFEDGILKLEARWEPDFPFIEEIHVPTFGDPLPYENITTPCLIGRRGFKYGYIEIRSKSADTQVTSAFWSMGDGLEFDFFESFGDGRGEGKEHLDSLLWWSIRDWDQLKGKPAYTERKNIGFRFADDFHIYGVDWSEEGIKYYIDGELFSSVTPEQATAYALENYDLPEDYDGYVATNEIFLWLDMEIFTWNGMPESREELTQNGTPEQKAGGYIDFEVDYVRVWQRGE